MNRNDVKRILYSLKTAETQAVIESVLQKVDRLTDENISQILSQIGDSEQAVKNYLDNLILEQIVKKHEDNHKIPLNKYITYGLTGSTIHLHLPIDLHDEIKQNGINRTIDKLNLYLLDAIDQIVRLKQENYHVLDNIDSLYMISPILLKRELSFLQSLDFDTKTFSKKQLSDPNFLQNNSEAILATKLFGTSNNVSSAIISLDEVSSPEWQQKKEEAKSNIHKKGIFMDVDKQLEEK